MNAPVGWLKARSRPAIRTALCERRVRRLPVLWFALSSLLAVPPAAAAQERDGAAADTAGAERDQPVPAGSETYVVVDTIVVIEDREGLVWGDWYLNPSIRRQIESAFEVEGKLSGRTWLESGAPIQDLELGDPEGDTQCVRFVDKGAALDFWEPVEVEYSWVFEGPWGLRANGTATAGEDSGVSIPVPLSSPPDRASLEPHRRVGRLDVTYRPRERGTRIPRGRFTIFLYYLSSSRGYRIAGVGY